MVGILLVYTDWIFLPMNVVNNYNDIQPSALQQTRLYVQGRPLLSYWRKDRRNIAYPRPRYLDLIDQELDSDYIAIDCGGWYFSNANRNCTAIELYKPSENLWPNIFFEYDYLTWCPDYLKPQPVLAYYSTYFKYCELANIVEFFNCWGQRHPKLIVGLDPTKIKFNYLKHNLLNLITNELAFNNKITVLEQSNFNLLFTVEKL